MICLYAKSLGPLRARKNKPHCHFPLARTSAISEVSGKAPPGMTFDPRYVALSILSPEMCCYSGIKFANSVCYYPYQASGGFGVEHVRASE